MLKFESIFEYPSSISPNQINIFHFCNTKIIFIVIDNHIKAYAVNNGILENILIKKFNFEIKNVFILDSNWKKEYIFDSVQLSNEHESTNLVHKLLNQSVNMNKISNITFLKQKLKNQLILQSNDSIYLYTKERKEIEKYAFIYHFENVFIISGEKRIEIIQIHKKKCKNEKIDKFTDNIIKSPIDHQNGNTMQIISSDNNFFFLFENSKIYKYCSVTKLFQQVICMNNFIISFGISINNIICALINGTIVKLNKDEYLQLRKYEYHDTKIESIFKIQLVTQLYCNIKNFMVFDTYFFIHTDDQYIVMLNEQLKSMGRIESVNDIKINNNLIMIRKDYKIMGFVMK